MELSVARRVVMDVSPFVVSFCVTRIAPKRSVINLIPSNIIVLITIGSSNAGKSEREYSVHSKLSRGAIQKAKRTGRMVLFSDGSINATASDAPRAGTSNPDQQRRSIASSENRISGPA